MSQPTVQCRASSWALAPFKRPRGCVPRSPVACSVYGNQFEPAPTTTPPSDTTPPSSPEDGQSEPDVRPPRDDDVLPDNLMDSLRQAAEATTFALTKGIERSTVEILLPEFWDPMSGAVFSQEGDQMRFWRLARCFADDLIAMTNSTTVTIIFPDIGVASYLKNAWDDTPFTIMSLNDRTPVSGQEDLVVIAAPDPPGAEDCIRINRMVPAETPVVLFNPRIVSGDVGVGLNVRRLRNQFLAQFITTYSIRPIGDIGTIFRKYPEQWQVYIQDEEAPGRYRKIADRPERPAGDALDFILDDAMGTFQEEGGEKQEPGMVQQLSRTMTSLNRFMKSLQN